MLLTRSAFENLLKALRKILFSIFINVYSFKMRIKFHVESLIRINSQQRDE